MNLPQSLKRILAAVLLSAPLTLVAADKAPHGGRLLDGAAVRAEFLVRPDRTVAVYLYTPKLAPVAPSDQAVSLVLQTRDGAKSKVDLIKGADAFASVNPASFSEGTKAILSVRSEGKPENFRFDLAMAPCKTCAKPEYACDCGH